VNGDRKTNRGTQMVQIQERDWKILYRKKGEIALNSGLDEEEND